MADSELSARRSIRAGLVVLLAVTAMATAQTATDEQAAKQVQELRRELKSRCSFMPEGILYSHTAGLKLDDADPAVIGALEAMLERPDLMGIQMIRSYRSAALVPALLRTADRDDIPLPTRCAAARAAFLCDGGVDPASKWIDCAFQDGTFAALSWYGQVEFLKLLPLLPPQRALACADTVAQWLDENNVEQGDGRRNFLKWQRRIIARCAEVEQLPESRQAQAVVAIGRPALRLARDPRRRASVVQELRKLKITAQAIWPLYLLDDLDVQLSADELAMLVMID